MFRRRKAALGIVATATALALTACSVGHSAFSSEENPDAVTFLVGYENNPGEPIDEALHHWAELLEEQSHGEMELELYPSSQLGSKTDLIDQMRAGLPVITLGDGAFFADQGVPDFGIVFAPYLFDTWDEVWKLTESDWYAGESQKLEDLGLKIVTSDWKYGDRDLLVAPEAKTVDDIAGLKIRVPNNVIQIDGFRALGATPTPMALGEVYTSLSQGTIDGLENPVPVLENGKFQEVAKNLLLTEHVRNFAVWFTGTTPFNNLTPEQQELLVSTGDEAGLYNNQRQDEVYDTTLQEMKDAGVNVVKVDREAFKEKAESFYDIPEIKKMFPPDLRAQVKKAMQ